MKVYKRVIVVFCVCAVALIAYYVNGDQSSKKIKDYGEKVTVKGKEMNVYTTDDGEKTIVLQPELGEFSQVYSYHNLIRELAWQKTIK